MNNYRASSGYVGWSESVRSYNAKQCGIYPKTQFKKEYGISEKVFNQIDDAGGFDTEWHHTSKYFNKTTFYKWNENGITMLAEINFDKYADTILSYIKFPQDIIWFESWYHHLWEQDCACMPLLDLVCAKMLEQEEEERTKKENKHLKFVNRRWFAQWIKNNDITFRNNDHKVFSESDMYHIYHTGDTYVEFNPSTRKIEKMPVTQENLMELNRKKFRQSFGVLSSISVDEYLDRCATVEFMKIVCSPSAMVSEDIHRKAARSTRDYMERKFAGTADYEYAMKLYEYYNS